MSSLWTPGGEVPIDRDPGPTVEGDDTPPDDDAAMRAQAEEMGRRLLEVPAADVVAQEAVLFYELAALHLSQPEPKLAEARLAIDALAAIVDALGERLGPAGAQLAEIVPQLRLAVVERSDG